MQSWPFITWCARNKLTVSIIVGILSSFGLACIKYPALFDKVSVVLTTILIGTLAIIAVIFGFIAAIWLLFPFPSKLGWAIGVQLDLFEEYDADRKFDTYGPFPWFIGIACFGVPIGAYFLGAFVLEIFTH